MSDVKSFFTANAASGYPSISTNVAQTSFADYVYAVPAKACILSLALYQPLPMMTYDLADHQRVPTSAQGAYMRDSDSLPVADRTNADKSILPAQASEPPAKTQDAGSGQVADVGTTPASRMKLLQRRMPPRKALQAIVDRGRTARDPWLDDEGEKD